MDPITDRLDQISELSEDDLKAYREEILTEFKSIDQKNLTPESVERMGKLADASDAVKAEESRRVEQASQLASDAANAAARIAGENADSASDEDDEDAPEELATAVAVVPDDEDDSDTEDSTDDSTDADATTTDDSSAPVEGSPAEEAGETPEEEAAEDSLDEANESPEEKDAEAQEEAAETPEEEAAEGPDDEDEEDKSTLSSNDSEIPNNTVAELAAEEVQTESSEEPVTASNTPIELKAPEDRRPAAAAAAPRYAITASAEMPNTPIGSKLPNLRAVAALLISRKQAMGNTTGGDNERASVAKFTTTYPENRTLDPFDSHSNYEKVQAVVASAIAKSNEEGALVAAGGLYAPVETSYDVFGFNETTDRPVRDSLPSFAADRGGIRYLTPPVMDNVSAAVSVWTLQDDIDAATDGAPDPVKPCLRIVAGSEVTVNTDAIPLCLTIGNLVARTYPEIVERHTELAMVWHARFAETRLLTRIGTLSTQVSATGQFGAGRDILVQLDQVAAAYRNRYRIDANTPLRVIFPEWFKNALRADLTKQLPGDGRDGTFNLAESEINTWFATRNINVTWHIDGEAGQIFGEQAAGAINPFPSTLVWYLFSEGTFLFLDGGELDLGLVRDSTLNGTNDYKIFLETFEGVAKVGIESLRVESNLLIAGHSAATI